MPARSRVSSTSLSITSLASIIAKYINQKKEETDMGDIVVVSPDLGGVTRARDLADRVNAPIAIIEKRVPSGRSLKS
mgnify:CR=1 FL=1